jgi:hypothetical protein
MGNPLKDPAGWIPKDLFVSYAGAEGTSKLAAFHDKAVARRNAFVPSLDWLALLLFPAWLGYRKQWPLLAVYTALFAALPLLELAFGFKVPSSAFVGIGVALGMHGNAFLLMSANSLYQKLLTQGLADDEIAARLRHAAKGGPALALGALVAFVAAVAISGLLFDRG